MPKEERVVQFRITNEKSAGHHHVEVFPELSNIYRSEGGESIILAIAANCVRIIAKRDGLERAMERFNKLVVNGTTVIR